MANCLIRLKTLSKSCLSCFNFFLSFYLIDCLNLSNRLLVTSFLSGCVNPSTTAQCLPVKNLPFGKANIASLQNDLVSPLCFHIIRGAIHLQANNCKMSGKYSEHLFIYDLTPRRLAAKIQLNVQSMLFRTVKLEEHPS